MTRVTLAAPAKVNLRLVVLAKETSGYHSLETLFCGVTLADSLRIEAGAPGIELKVVGSIDTGEPHQNLVIRAARLFFDELGMTPAVRIVLEKRIPAAAGLGGGSSDAAATLRGLNELHGRPVSPTDLLALSGRLGSDVPFFLSPTPFALAWNRGDRLLSLDPPPRRPVLIAMPASGMSTSRAFASLEEFRAGDAEPPGAGAFAASDLARWNNLERLAMNDFEAVATRSIPEFHLVKRALAVNGATIALLSGSGSAIFGVFEDVEAREMAVRALNSEGMATVRAETLEAWPGAVPRD